MTPVYFPHDIVRPVQDKLMKQVGQVIDAKQHLIAHAPTGLGKTASTLAPAITYALKHKKRVLFLTSRHTQQAIALDTVKNIREKFNLDLHATCLVGKKGMCLQPHIELLGVSDFFEYCKKVREDRTCEFYVNARESTGKLSPLGKNVLSRIKKRGPLSTEEMMQIAREEQCCAYELAMAMAKESQVIIGDYYYLFHPSVAKSFLKKLEVEHEDLIVIVDEGHNLPSRIRDLGTQKISSFMIKRAVQEVKKYNQLRAVPILASLQQALLELSHRLTSEKLVSRQDFLRHIAHQGPVDELCETLDEVAEQIREIRGQSSVSVFSPFLLLWQEELTGYTRIMTVEKGKRDEYLTLYYKCLDPAVITREVIAKVHSVILMSGTLLPTAMYRDVLGFDERVQEAVYASPFPPEHRLNLIVPRTTTQYAKRSMEQFKAIAAHVDGLCEVISGNVAVFFPSYSLQSQVHALMQTQKEVLVEHGSLSKAEKEQLLSNFRSHAKKGAVLLACQSGSFGEGIDLPGDELSGVIVVGLPLARPDLETKELIRYFDQKFGKGWDYGYVAPAFSKILQSAGRCIRSETDKGVIIFLDERFAWPNYRSYFPDETYKVSVQPKEDIALFFGRF